MSHEVSNHNRLSLPWFLRTGGQSNGNPSFFRIIVGVGVVAGSIFFAKRWLGSSKPPPSSPSITKKTGDKDAKNQKVKAILPVVEKKREKSADSPPLSRRRMEELHVDIQTEEKLFEDLQALSEEEDSEGEFKSPVTTPRALTPVQSPGKDSFGITVHDWQSVAKAHESPSHNKGAPQRDNKTGEVSE